VQRAWLACRGSSSGCVTEGLPIGVQIIGRPFEEELVLAVAEIIEKAGLVSKRSPPGAMALA